MAAHPGLELQGGSAPAIAADARVGIERRVTQRRRRLVGHAALYTLKPSGDAW